MSRRNVLIQLSGSIAAYKACHVVSRLTQAGCDVRTMATPAALNFVGAATLEGLSGHPVAADTFAAGSAMDHINLVRWADLILLCPATANTINKMAAGIGDDLVSTSFLAHDFSKPFLVAPAMNVAMWEHPATSASIEQLRRWGLEILQPDAGSLACGEIGAGRLIDPDVIVQTVLARLDSAVAPTADWVAPLPAAEHPMRVLITAGGTSAPIDGVRSITNTSTGATGALLAEWFARNGHHVTLIHARDAVVPDTALFGPAGSVAPLQTASFVTFSDLDDVLRTRLASGSFDAVIHNAAVSDYGVDHLTVDGRRVGADPATKIDSGDSFTIHLTKNHKILSRLKDYAGKDLIVVGFKLTKGATAEQRLQAVRRITPGTDLVVHNDASEIDAVRHLATIYADGQEVAEVQTKAELAKCLEDLVGALVQRNNAAVSPA